jgi:hypothetical protein
MKLTPIGTLSEEAIGLLQRALNALGRGEAGQELLAVDRRFGKRTLAALIRFLAARGAAGETRLRMAIAALRGPR